MSEEKKKNWFVRHKILTVIIAIFGIAIISTALGGGADNTTNNSSTQSSDNSSTEKKTETESKDEVAKIGTAVRDGKFEFTVKGIECGKASVGSEYLTKEAQGQFCLLSVSVKNIGNEAQSLLSSDQYLFNASDQKYSADDTATLYNSPNGTSWYTDINPGNSVEGAIVFDIPKDQTPVVAELHDSAFSSGVKVNLQ